MEAREYKTEKINEDLKQALKEKLGNLHEKAADLSKIQELMENITKELENYIEDIEVLLDENLNKELKEGQIHNMKKAFPKLKEMINKAAKIISTNKKFDPYKEQLNIAIDMVVSLGPILR